MDLQLVANRYEMLRRIGVGGMASVYQAHDRKLSRDVAMKVLHGESASDPLFVERFRREAQAAAALNHPNIVSIYDWGQVGDTYFMVMEYVPGGNLKERLQAGGPFPEQDVVLIGEQVAAALEVAHRHGIIHRDVKPHNVLLDSDGHAKVADFGIARASGLSQLTRTNVVCGTAQYISPEQAQCKPLDGRSDLYSLGVVLYELLTGVEPFNGDSLIEIAMQHITQLSVPPRQLNPNTSPLVNEIVMKALAKEPADRYQTAAEMGTALHQARRVPPSIPAQETASNPIVAPAAETSIPGSATHVSDTWHSGTVARERESHHRWIMAVPAVLLGALLGGGAILAGPSLLGARGAPSAHHPSHPVALRSSHPLPTATRPAAHATSTPAPTAMPTVAPTSAPPTAVSVSTAVVAGAPPSGIGDSSPRGAVLIFYQLISAREFRQASGLWTPAMQAANPPSSSIDSRFADTSQIAVRAAQVVDRTSDTATVKVDLVETKASGAVYRIVGDWQVIRTASGWLLSGESLRFV